MVKTLPPGAVECSGASKGVYLLTIYRYKVR